AAAPAKSSAPRIPVSASGRDLRVLLVEDNVINQRLATRLLEKWGFNVTLAVNGKAALEALQSDSPQSPFDIVLMDVQMPEMDGIEATRLIRHREMASGSRPIPVVAMTAHAMNGDRERCLEAGMDAYISKPIEAQSLLTSIEGLVRRP
ncbi:MAG: response regulator, partial [Deltaproteobacteria bacterium]|nr:response regulator [Deltaproteobacteria bacterium]